MPEPFDDINDFDLVDLRSKERARAALERFGDDVWMEALDWLFDHATKRPTSAAAYPESRRAFFAGDDGPGPAPEKGMPAAAVLAEFRARLAPHTFNAQYPGSYSYFTPPPLPMAIAGELLAAWMNQGIDLWLPGMAGPFVEEEVVRWLCDLAGYDAGSWGVLTSGGVMANVMGLAVGRDVHLKKLLGLSGPPRAGNLSRARVYASDQAHFSIARGLGMLGFPAETLRVLPSDEAFRLRSEPVAAAVEEDREAGLVPFCLAPVVGSTNTGAVDDLNDLATLAEREGLWLHVDAAYGGAARLSPETAGRFDGLGRADSMTIDPHKWLYQPYDIGALLVRRRADILHTFESEPEYYRVGDPDQDPLHWYRYSIEGTRRFRALKLWLSWKHLGTRGFARLIAHDIALAGHLARRSREAGFEVVDPELSVVCLRVVPPGLGPEAVDEHQRALQRALELSGAGWVSTTSLRGRTWLRAGVVNYLSTEADADRIVDALQSASERILEELHGRTPS